MPPTPSVDGKYRGNNKSVGGKGERKCKGVLSYTFNTAEEGMLITMPVTAVV